MERTADPDKGSDVQAVTRAAQILFAFTSQTPELGLTQLAARLDLSKATVHRIAQTLVSTGLLEQNPATRGYHLGIRLLHLVDVLDNTLDIRTQSRAALHELRERTGETVYLMLLRGDQAVCAERLEGAHPMRDLSTPPGTVVALTTGAAGSAILSVMTDPQVRATLDTVSPQRRRPEVRLRVQRAREQGYAFSRGDIAQGVGALAAPLVDARGTIVGAISLGGLLERVEQSEAALASAVCRAAAQVATSMGWKTD